MSINIKDISEKDRNAVLHPFTQLKDFATGKLGEPTIVETGKGIRIQDAHGNQLIDGFAGLYCVNVGYGRTEVAEAISRQAFRLAYYHSYAAHTTDELAILSDRLVKMAPGKMSKVFYGMSGSDANETQAKLVWYYNNLRGKPTKKKIISRERGYHGCSVVSGSMTGMSFYHDHMDLPLPQIVHTGVPHHYWGATPGETELEFSARRGEELDQLIERLGPDNVGGFIGEPVLGTGGITPPPEGYWQAIQAVLKKHDVLLIADEVITGFGRTGSMFGSQHYGIEPDLITIAKGLTSAYFPLSAAIVGEKVYKVLEDGADKVGAFSHGYTYSGHPIGAAAANAVLDIVEKEDLPGNARDVGAFFQAQLQEKFAQLPIVGEVRGVGLMAAIEFVADRGKKKRFDPSLKVGARISKAARDRGLIVRAMPHGDILGFAPPLVTTKSEVEEIIGIAESAVRFVMDELTREGA
ncbi:MAG: aminotransferase class III-fold pyridoxal phosphate-dependent enzyme [Mesorhizobium sp.]|uniref:aspartate aminotransferase family protein n=1 Tax=unclassified Mesorhizobium TaxID=325217 RepID=UPI000F74E692|nr:MULTISPECIES: aspartate aminotransferase family protein [unclassified Mesorhizobium]AZO50278.1 aspartate aminotransferase family protein [Mesorhizobium sp. M4B.F.Ca.ET.058.02.1.1]RUU99032.1 aminotransferase class III-fold pyridoxal phosphate-dependent enzyme [Mesorhizobium sp. M6A.T.Cr.TU.017.01.1.1]RWD25815.1 MAG: aminotransferase class III-fold pyridoxal phosphate-dependent enzyme [Mesorhizobium sp.]RWP14617.1 MAG: aminotransferase class III-fold pyridoxal phosphate-dependent enzyme [Mesor